MFEKIFDKILSEEEETLEKVSEIEEEVKKSVGEFFFTKETLIGIFIFLAALVVRLYSLFYITNPQNAGVELWYSDVYHHWQIAYLSKEIGFKEGFLRLWDLKGLEYFWGLAHPLFGAALIALTGSTSIVVFRIFSAVLGSLALVFLFFIVRRFWGWQPALGAVIIGALNPVGFFSDASGMVEPLGIALTLGGILLFPRNAVLSGFFLAIAGMTRAEYWILGALIVLGMLLVKTPVNKKSLLLLGYLVPMLVYMKYLLNWTGNPIYPIWWSFLGNAVGKWQLDIPPTADQLAIQKVYWGIAAVSLGGIFWTFLKRPGYTPFFLFGFGNWLMWGVFIGMTKYLLSYSSRFWVDRIMIWPYLFAGTLLSIFLLHIIPKIFPKRIRMTFSLLGFLIVFLVLLVSQLAWLPIHYYYDPTEKRWDRSRGIAAEIGKHDSREGRILLPEFLPPLTYMLVHFEKIEGPRIIGQMFDPYYYIEGDPYKNWGKNRETVFDWLKEENIKRLVFTSEAERYVELVKREPGYFEELFYKPEWGIHIYEVKQSLIR